MSDHNPTDLGWLDECPVPVLATDGDQRVVAVSTALEQVTGVSRAELLGRRPEEIRSPLWRSLCNDEPMVGFTRRGSHSRSRAG